MPGGETLDQGGGDEAYERLRANAVLHQSLAVPASTRPGVGKVIEFVKRFILRAAFLNVQGIIEQQSRVNGDLIAELRRLADDVDGLRAQRSARSGGSPAQQDAVVDRRARGLKARNNHFSGRTRPATPPLTGTAVSASLMGAADAHAMVRIAGDLRAWCRGRQC